jgi:hypothetical protein
MRDGSALCSWKTPTVAVFFPRQKVEAVLRSESFRELLVPAAVLNNSAQVRLANLG